MTEEKENCNFQQNYNVFGLDDKPCCYLYHKYCDEIDSCYFKRCKRLEQEKNKYYQQTLDDEITMSDLIAEIQELKADRTLERISKLSIENARLEQENKQMKSILEEIKEILNLGVCKNGVNGNCRPIRNTKKEDCYNAIYKVKGLINEVLQ